MFSGKVSRCTKQVQPNKCDRGCNSQRSNVRHQKAHKASDSQQYLSH